MIDLITGIVIGFIVGFVLGIIIAGTPDVIKYELKVQPDSTIRFEKGDK